MKLETLLLRSLFAACLMLSSLILGSMLLGHPAAKSPAGSVRTTEVAPGALACPLPPDGVICPRRVSTGLNQNG